MSTENNTAQQPAPASNELPNGQAAPAENGVAAPEGQPQENQEGAPAEPVETPEHRKASYRFSELTKQLREAERQREYYRGLADANAQRGGQNAPPPANEAPIAAADPEPNPEDFQGKNYDPEYLKAVARWEGRQAVKQATEAATKAAAEAQAFEVGRARFIEARTDAEQIEQQFPEYAGAVAQTLDNIARAEPPGPNRLIDVVTKATNRGWVAAALATKPGLLNSLWSMDPVSRALEIGRIDAQISRNLSAQPAPAQAAPQAPAVSPTPAAQPPATLNGRGATPNFNPETASPAEYHAARQSGRYQ